MLWEARIVKRIKLLYYFSNETKTNIFYREESLYWNSSPFPFWILRNLNEILTQFQENSVGFPVFFLTVYRCYVTVSSISLFVHYFFLPVRT